MKTIIYISRHSEPIRFRNYQSYNSEESDQIRNEKNSLSVNGEKLAKRMSKLKELHNIDYLYCSNYVRAIQTAKYIAKENNILINVDYRLGERKFGIPIKDLTHQFFMKQLLDFDYKLGDGESLNETAKRMNEAIDDIIAETMGSKTAIISHGTAIISMLKRYCTIKVDEDTENITILFNDNEIFKGKFKTPELFKLDFEDHKLINIKNLTI